MNPEERADLAFICRMTAGISHEIKNGLAVAVERAGLADDLLALAERGRPLDPKRLKELIERVLVRLDLVNTIVRDLNHLAHALDEDHKVFDINEQLQLSARLAARAAHLKKVELTAVPQPCQNQVESKPFLFLRLAVALIEQAVARTDSGGAVVVRSACADDWVGLELSGDARPTPGPAADEVAMLLGLLDGEIVFEPEPAMTRLRLNRVVADRP